MKTLLAKVAGTLRLMAMGALGLVLATTICLGVSFPLLPKAVLYMCLSGRSSSGLQARRRGVDRGSRTAFSAKSISFGVRVVSLRPSLASRTTCLSVRHSSVDALPPAPIETDTLGPGPRLSAGAHIPDPHMTPATSR